MREPIPITYKQILFLFLAGMMFPAVLQAQHSLEAGLSGGVAYYNGDIVPGVPFVMPKPAYGVVVRYNFGDRWTTKITYTNAKAAGDITKSKPVVQGLQNFTTTIHDISAMGEFNFMEYSTGSKKYNFTPYITAGAGFFAFNTEDIDPTVKSHNFAAIFGLGFKYSLSKRFGLSAEWRMHKTFTDMLDGQEGNSGTNDWFGVANISLTYKIEFNNNCGCKNQRW